MHLILRVGVCGRVGWRRARMKRMNEDEARRREGRGRGNTVGGGERGLMECT